MTDQIAPFLGTWILDLDESEFDQSDLPKAGRCTIEEEFGLVCIRMTLITAVWPTGYTCSSRTPGPSPLRPSGASRC